MNRTIPYMSLLALTLLSLGGQACKKNSDSSIKADGDDLKIHIYKGEGSVIDYLKKQSTANPDLGTRVEVIEPEETRSRLLHALEVSRDKVAYRPEKKHGIQ